jgi:hypothetical protein
MTSLPKTEKVKRTWVRTFNCSSGITVYIVSCETEGGRYYEHPHLFTGKGWNPPAGVEDLPDNNIAKTKAAILAVKVELRGYICVKRWEKVS